jgi:hypothetical protein
MIVYTKKAEKALQKKAEKEDTKEECPCMNRKLDKYSA